MKVLSVVGARPQFVKAFPVSEALGTHEHVLVHTGQHYDRELSDVFFEELPIPEPDVNLGVGSGTHAEQTGSMVAELDTVVARESPDVVLVYGDTNSTLAAALVGAKRDVRLAHVEAGLRSDNRAMPEEINRVLTDHCSDLLFAPSERAVETLAGEGVTEGVHEVGDVTYDALLAVRDRARDRSRVLDRLGHDDGEYILATVHRAANTEDEQRLAAIVEGLADAPLPVVFPAHPRTIAALKAADGIGDLPESVHLVDPVGYLDFVRLLDGAERVATDSGGVQKEAFYLDTPCVTMREETEWIETVEAGWNVLVGADAGAIRRNLGRRFAVTEKPQPYGDGNTAERIVRALDRTIEAAPVEDAVRG
ncbi:UDP-N-acetylglucosamine 2-epimerase (non-hydrolyzing) (plasmid) [Halorientalis sp. IM1011]|uniref:non-hydrolyzing UDP-N-acetylglucosamine 2-epimerase n=1 Tax=Halorientalis sp. IM1011 TaxID=1932360 RepID=UPI00097CD6DE|nr:UDP-N-acetylglucosamine 2-epimerase (non-hydrolyzing) [Halorientalis sp. IM1011]AQL44891.1 UDP-N-acetylglucosamine 2-epimerase (non-hydrolyzing) [Halorientalis sp. IM1011]